MSDYAHRMTDAELAQLENRIKGIYKEAATELNDTVTAYFADFERRDAEQQRLLDTGKITKDQYTQWRLAQIGRGQRYEALRDKVAERYTKANELAVAYVNDRTPSIYSLNRNYAAYTIEKAHPGADFTLYDESTVRRLAMRAPQLMPNYPAEKALRRGIDLKYGKKQITASITSSILQGKSIRKIADNLQERMETMNRASAIRTARTAFTSAQNGGRVDTYKAATLMGIDLQQEWLATLDGRTRHSHRALDGERINVGETFSNGCRFPGDPEGAPAETYNCRCTLVAVVDGVDTSDAKRRARNEDTGRNEVIPNMTYSQWANRKESEEESGFINWVKDKLHVKAPGLSNETVDAMNSILGESKHESVRNLFDNYSDEIKCVDHNARENKFNRSDGGVHLKEETLKYGSRYKNPYQSAFHEFAHNIDWLMGGRNDKTYASNRKIAGVRLYELLDSDYNRLKRNYRANSDEEFIDKLKQVIADNGYTERDVSLLSDVLQGCTGIVRPINTSHGEGYYSSEEKREREFFAEVIESAAANENSYLILKEMFPKSFEFVGEMIGGL